jgi:hypothetical protein
MTMRSLLVRTTIIAAGLSLVAEATTIVFLTHAIQVTSDAHGAASYGAPVAGWPEPLAGFRALWMFLSDPTLAAEVLLPQAVLYFVFLWAAAFLSARFSVARAERPPPATNRRGEA